MNGMEVCVLAKLNWLPVHAGWRCAQLGCPLAERAHGHLL